MRPRLLNEVLVCTALGMTLCLPLPTVGASQKPRPVKKAPDARPVAARRDPLGVKDPKQFFPWFLAMQDKMTAPRSQFETEEAHRKRLPPPFDSEKVVYLPIARGEHTYDIDSRTLTLAAVARPATHPDLKAAGCRCSLMIGTEEVPRGSYVGQNAYGAKVKIEKTDCISYELAFLNGHSSPAFDLETGRISVDLTLDPPQAERLSRSYQIVLGVTLPGYEQSKYCKDHSAPETDAPFDRTFFSYCVRAVLREVIIRDRHTLSVLRRVPVGPEEEGSPGLDE